MTHNLTIAVSKIFFILCGVIITKKLIKYLEFTIIYSKNIRSNIPFHYKQRSQLTNEEKEEQREKNKGNKKRQQSQLTEKEKEEQREKIKEIRKGNEVN